MKKHLKIREASAFDFVLSRISLANRINRINIYFFIYKELTHDYIEAQMSVLLFRNMLLPQSQEVGDPGEPMF